MKKLLILMLAIGIQSCCPKLTQSAVSDTQHSKDSTSVVLDSTYYTQQIVKLQGEVLRLQGIVSIDDHCLPFMDTVFIETAKAKASASISKGRLSVNCDCKDREELITAQNRLIKKYQQSAEKLQKSNSTVKVQTVQYTPKPVKVLAAIGVLSIILLILYFITWIHKKTT